LALAPRGGRRTTFKSEISDSAQGTAAMNTIYRLVFNLALGCLQVASEVVRSRSIKGRYSQALVSSVTKRAPSTLESKKLVVAFRAAIRLVSMTACVGLRPAVLGINEALSASISSTTVWHFDALSGCDGDRKPCVWFCANHWSTTVGVDHATTSR
jgi:hypothetical protein